MRQSSGDELDFVSVSNNYSSTKVTVNGNDLNLGNYKLVLESFDQSNAV